MPQTVKNLDKAASRLLNAGSTNLAARMAASTARIRSRSDAEGKFIAEGSKAAADLIDADPALAKRAIEHALGEAVGAQKNRETILEIAAEELSIDEADPADAPTEIDDDWLNLFSTFAAAKSNEDVQSLWGKILAGEIRQPGSFSLRALSQLSTISTEEANFIYRFMPLVIGEFIYAGPNNRFASLNDLVLLQELGVVTGVGGTLGREMVLDPNTPGRFWCNPYVVEVAAPVKDRVVLKDVCVLTRFGLQLYKLCGELKPDKDYITAFAKSLVSKSRTVELLVVGPWKDGETSVLSITLIE